MKCEKCGQLSFAGIIEYKGQSLCTACYGNALKALYDWGNERLAIKMLIGSSYTDYDELIVPFAENADDYTDMDVAEAFTELKNKWEGMKWGFHGNVNDMELIEVSKDQVKDPKNTIRCSEFWDLWIYKELAIESDLYNTPWDASPDGQYFSCWFARDCTYGNVYSKDFAYFQCPDCGRDICQQNPSNGWHTQYRFVSDYEMVCISCLQEQQLKDGIDVERVLNSESLDQAMFFDHAELESNGWVEADDTMLVGMGRFDSSYGDAKRVFDRIKHLDQQGYKIIIDIDSMAIGGLGGYVTMYVKPKEVLV